MVSWAGWVELVNLIEFQSNLVDLVAITWALQIAFLDDANWIFAATVAIAGIIYHNTSAGRPGEWGEMTRAMVEEFLASEAEGIAIGKHKNYKKIGETGKYIPPGLAKAMRFLRFTISGNYIQQYFESGNHCNVKMKQCQICLM